MSENP